MVNKNSRLVVLNIELFRLEMVAQVKCEEHHNSVLHLGIALNLTAIYKYVSPIIIALTFAPQKAATSLLVLDWEFAKWRMIPM